MGVLKSGNSDDLFFIFKYIDFILIFNSRLFFSLRDGRKIMKYLSSPRQSI